jgi:hypothetical protein
MTEILEKKAKIRLNAYRNDPKGWCLFAEEVLGVTLDDEQKDILTSVQHNPMTSVASGTARGKDFIAAVASLCFFVLTPRWKGKGKNREMIANTKVAMTAPTDRQVGNIMVPEVSRLWHRAKARGVDLPGRLTGYDIRTDNKEWFLTGFKADEHQTEAWTGFHAVNTMFVVTEASGMADSIFTAIEGNLQGNSRLLIVFNPNVSVGYAAKSQKSPRFAKFRLNSLNAYNVQAKKDIIPGQVDYKWVVDKIQEWCISIQPEEVDETKDDFQFEGRWYRPDDRFRVKVLGKFPEVSEDTLIPAIWVEMANQRWLDFHKTHQKNNGYPGRLRLGVDVAGMGRDNSDFCYRYDNVVAKIEGFNSGGVADHMKVAGVVNNVLKTNPKAQAMIDTIGEGAGVYSRLVELGLEKQAFSCKYSHAAEDHNGKLLTDLTGQYQFLNMRAYVYWALRDWLNPKNKMNAMLPPDDILLEELTEMKWGFKSNGRVFVEPKEDIKARLGRSPDKADSLANTFMPVKEPVASNLAILSTLR